MTGSLAMVTGLSDRSYGQSRCHVGFEANLRKSAVLLSLSWGDLAGRLNVCQPLALAKHLLCGWTGVPGRRAGGIAEAQRQPCH